jgi:DNA-binding NarL/FixJ family response regulator
MKHKIKIIIVDDSPTFLEGITTFLDKENEFEILACFASGNILLDEINNYSPDVVLLDIEMPGLNGIETARRLNWYRTELKLIAITMYHDNLYLKQLIEAGFHGFVNKNNVYENLSHAIKSVLKKEFAFPKIRIM